MLLARLLFYGTSIWLFICGALDLVPLTSLGGSRYNLMTPKGKAT